VATSAAAAAKIVISSRVSMVRLNCWTSRLPES
jgi:hypothetical protein